MNQCTIQAQRALQLAIEVAEECHHQYIGTEHILLGLVREGTAVAGKVLKANNVTEDKIIEMIAKFIHLGSVCTENIFSAEFRYGKRSICGK